MSDKTQLVVSDDPDVTLKRPLPEGVAFSLAVAARPKAKRDFDRALKSWRHANKQGSSRVASKWRHVLLRIQAMTNCGRSRRNSILMVDEYWDRTDTKAMAEAIDASRAAWNQQSPTNKAQGGQS